MDGSFVSKARIAINSAAAKAEKVLTDIKKSDSHSPASTDLGKQSPRASTPESPEEAEQSRDLVDYASKRARSGSTRIVQDLQDTLQKIGISRRGAESEKAQNSGMAYAIFDENLYMMGEREFSQSKDSEDGDTGVSSRLVEIDIIPSSVILKQLAFAIESSSTYNSMIEVQASSKASSPIKERAGVSFSTVKSLVLREKEDKLTSNFNADENVGSVINTLVNAEGLFTAETISSPEFQLNATALIKDIHGAPVESLVVKLSEALGRLRTLRKMASFWSKFVSELRILWLEGQYVPGIPPDEKPDLNSCLLYQQLQVINCCISRKRRHLTAVESLESVTKEDRSHAGVPSSPNCYAKTKFGELVLRLGADRKSDKLTMLETGEPVYSPILQEPPLLTEDVIRETEEFVLRTGSVGAGCSQLLSDMQAFKAANPGCILGDFVRWHSPPDWTVDESSSDLDDASEGDLSFSKGQLSRRMQKEGNLWRELWETSKPVPAVRQSPLYDEDLAVEGILDYLQEIPPHDLFKQLYVAALGAGLVIAESTLSGNASLSDMLADCKNYIVLTCQSSSWVEKIDDICQVYETVERMLLNPDEMSKGINEETTSESKNRFRRLSSIFRGKNRAPSKNNENNSMLQPLSSIFSRKAPKPQSPSPSPVKSCASAENDWTIV